jgi:hypothetical protein
MYKGQQSSWCQWSGPRQKKGKKISTSGSDIYHRVLWIHTLATTIIRNSLFLIK